LTDDMKRRARAFLDLDEGRGPVPVLDAAGAGRARSSWITSSAPRRRPTGHPRR
jgi:hypothetical protein